MIMPRAATKAVAALGGAQQREAAGTVLG